MYHSFKGSLAKGQKGEELLLEVWPGLTRLDGRKHDFVTEDGETLELKTDSYSVDKTQNFFIELVSSIQGFKVGGPAQALKNGTTYWVYLYSTSKVMYVFETEKLVKEINKLLLTERVELCLIPNRTWTTIGAKIPRRLLSHIYTERRFDNAG